MWDRLDRELQAWQAEGRTARFWWRDDDAVTATPELARFAATVGNCGAVLAVIPAAADAALARFVAANPQLRVAVHGWSHANHAAASEKKQELGAHRPNAIIMGEIAAGLARLRDMVGPQVISMLVPPWNRMAPALLPLLPEVGIRSVSMFGAAPRHAPLCVMNTHVDLIDWHGSRGGRDPRLLVDEIVRELERRRLADSGEPLGVLSHHLVSDETAFRFAADLMHATVHHPACRWLSASEVL
jgi:hypothetical protein